MTHVTCPFKAVGVEYLRCVRKIHFNVAFCSKALLPLCFGALVVSWAACPSNPGLSMRWGTEDKGCHCCCCCCGAQDSIAWWRIKTHTGRTPATEQRDVTINKLQDVGSQLPAYMVPARMSDYVTWRNTSSVTHIETTILILLFCIRCLFLFWGTILPIALL